MKAEGFISKTTGKLVEVFCGRITANEADARIDPVVILVQVCDARGIPVLDLPWCGVGGNTMLTRLRKRITSPNYILPKDTNHIATTMVPYNMSFGKDEEKGLSSKEVQCIVSRQQPRVWIHMLNNLLPR